MRRRSSSAAAIAGASICLGLLAAPGGAAVVLDDGHVDYAARMVGGELQSQVKDGTQPGPAVWREPAEVLFRLGSGAAASVPAGSGFAFLGAPGSRLWMIPQVQRPGVLWAGWNSEELGPSQVSGDLAWQLDAVEGPGRVAVFQTSAFGQADVSFDSGDGLPDTRSVPLGTHAHGNWAFGAPGEYRLTFTMSAERAGGGLSSDTEVLTVAVLDDGAAPGSGGGAGSPAGGADGQGKPDKQGGAPTPKLRPSSARLRGRLLALSVQLSEPGRVAVAVRRAGRTLVRTPARAVGAEKRRLRFRLAKRLEPGRYRLAVSARVGSATVRETLALRVGGDGA